jgi:hypothetical protein
VRNHGHIKDKPPQKVKTPSKTTHHRHCLSIHGIEPPSRKPSCPYSNANIRYPIDLHMPDPIPNQETPRYAEENQWLFTEPIIPQKLQLTIVPNFVYSVLTLLIIYLIKVSDPRLREAFAAAHTRDPVSLRPCKCCLHREDGRGRVWCT